MKSKTERERDRIKRNIAMIDTFRTGAEKARKENAHKEADFLEMTAGELALDVVLSTATLSNKK